MTNRAPVNLRNDYLAMQRLSTAAEEAAQTLNSSPLATVSLKFLAMDFVTKVPLHLDMTVRGNV